MNPHTITLAARILLMLRAIFLSLAVLSSPAALAQTGPIKILVGYPPGATSDTLTRVIAEAMAGRLGQPVVVENKPGAGGQIANQLVRAANPDGTTLMMTPVATMSIFPHSYGARLQYDPFKHFAPVAHLSNFQLGLGVATSVPAGTLAEYVAWVKAQPDTRSLYGSAASGSLPHFFGVLFGKSAGIDLRHVPYRGTAASMQALASGEIIALSTVAADIGTLVDSGRAKLLAVAGEARSPRFPNVPTFREQGFDLVATPWYALFTTAGTPEAVVNRLAKAALDSVADPAVRQRMLAMGVEPTGYPPARLSEIMRADYERWGPPIRDSGFKPD